MPISIQHKNGLRDLFINEEKNTSILIQLAKSVTKNICKVYRPEEALSYLTVHVEDIHKLLYKRHVTREILFKYLHTRLRDGGGITTDFTKSDLVMRIIQYWDQGVSVANPTVLIEEQYPIHLMARKFSEWFFDNFNRHNMQLLDFWMDACLQLQIIADDGVSTVQCASGADVLAALVNVQQQFNFHFNTNLTHAGVQGRMDAHGLVMVLSCGTLHTATNCVGIFEFLFGLLRDPHAGNNWKIKKIKSLLRSEVTQQLHSLDASQSLQDVLALPAPSEELD